MAEGETEEVESEAEAKAEDELAVGSAKRCVDVPVGPSESEALRVREWL